MITMALRDMFDRYRRYKAGTAKIVNYLVSTAQQCGNIATILPSLKAAKKASKSAKRDPSSVTASETAVQVNTVDLVKLAEIVSKSKLDVPLEIYVVKDVIAGRRTCADWYKAISKDDDPDRSTQDQSHMHFIRVLENIHDLLEAALKAQKAPKRRSKFDKAPSEEPALKDLANCFSSLQIEESPDWTTGPAEGQKTVNTELTYRLADDGEQKMFAVWCLLQDLHDIRKQVRERWLDWRLGKLSFDTACIITDTSLNIARDTERRFAKHYPDVQSMDDILNVLDLDIDTSYGHAYVYDKAIIAPARGPKLSRSCDALTDMLCPQGFVILTAFRAMMFSNGATDTLDIDDDIKLAFDCTPFGPALMRATPHMLSLAEGPASDEVVLDQFTSLLLGIAVCPAALRPWQVFSCQVQCDAYDIISSTEGFGFAPIKQKLEHDVNTVQTYMRRVGPAACCRCETSVFARVVKAGEQVSRCLTCCPGGEGHEAPLCQPAPVREWCGLQKNLPISLGLTVGLDTFHMHKLGTELCDNGRLVLCTAYLYRTVRLAGLLEEPWPDMDFVIQAQSKRRPFVRESSRGVAAMAKYFGMALGAKEASFHYNRRPKPPKSETICDSARNLEEDFPLMSSVERLDPTRGTVADCDSAVTDAAIRSLGLLAKAGVRGARIDGLSKQVLHSGKVTPDQLLFGLGEVLILDELDLKFNYVEFYLRCFDVLQAVRMACRYCVERVQRPYVDDWEQSAIDLVYVILWDAADEAEGDFDASWSMLRMAASPFRQLVKQSEGGQYHDRAREQASGHTPDHLQPRGNEEAMANAAKRALAEQTFGKLRSHFTGSLADIESDPSVLVSNGSASDRDVDTVLATDGCLSPTLLAEAQKAVRSRFEALPEDEKTAIRQDTLDFVNAHSTSASAERLRALTDIFQ